jgi:hypothetical protein
MFYITMKAEPTKYNYVRGSDINVAQYQLIATAECTFSIGLQLSRFSTRCCTGEDQNHDSTVWVDGTATTKVIPQGSHATLVTGWCANSWFRLPRKLTADWYTSNLRVTNRLTVTRFSASYYSWIINCV